nr:hypothetical protein [Tanacetum cinerariifolium]
MKATPVEMYGEMEEQSMTTSAMEVDDVDSFDLFGEVCYMDCFMWNESKCGTRLILWKKENRLMIKPSQGGIVVRWREGLKVQTKPCRVNILRLPWEYRLGRVHKSQKDPLSRLSPATCGLFMLDSTESRM